MFPISSFPASSSRRSRRSSRAPLPLSLPWQPPERFLGFLQAETHCAFLDSGGDPSHPRQRWSLLCPQPAETLVVDKLLFTPANQLKLSGPKAGLDVLRRFHERHFSHADLFDSFPETAFPGSTDLPFTGGTIGAISYEAGLAHEGVASRHDRSDVCLKAWPALIAMACTSFYLFDRRERRLWWLSAEGIPPPAPPPFAPAPLPPLDWKAEFTREEWVERVEETRRLIEAGDIFQANLTMRWQAEAAGSLLLDGPSLYAALRAACPAPFGAYLALSESGQGESGHDESGQGENGQLYGRDLRLMSASVERFLSLSPNGRVETRPIKGTAPVSDDPVEDAAHKEALGRDEKERAENLMITDLLRNDIGRVCRLGSVEVPQLCEVERFARVHHLVSSVTGQLATGQDAVDLLEATLPPGSVAGAPKKRALEIIDALEASPRGAYCGTLFRLGRDGALDSSVLIRTVEQNGDALRLGTGGGITWPSDPHAEYRETRLKAAPILEALGGEKT